MTWLEFVEAGCKTIEAPAATPESVSVSVSVNLTGTIADSILAGGVAVSTRVDYEQDTSDLDPDTFGLGRNECGDPGAVSIQANTPVEIFARTGLAAAAAVVTSPQDTDGIVELYYNGGLNALSAAIRIGPSTVFDSGLVGTGDVITPSTWDETRGIYIVVLETSPGADPEGTVTFSFEIA